MTVAAQRFIASYAPKAHEARHGHLHRAWGPIGAGVERCANCGTDRIQLLNRGEARALGMPASRSQSRNTVYRRGPGAPWTFARPPCGGTR